jgi:hypothetical protein
MKSRSALAALSAAAALLAGCGSSDDGSPTASENAQLNQIAEQVEMDTSPDSLAVEDADLGNGDQAQTGDAPVADDGNSAGNAAAPR